MDIKEYKQKLARFCAYRERCEQEVRQKLWELGAAQDLTDEIVVMLQEENYLNDARFALQYVHGKFNLNKWGKIKIRYGLQQKKLDAGIIDQAIQTIDQELYENTMHSLISQKLKSMTGANDLTKKYKIVNYMAQKGYENELTFRISDEYLS